VFVTKTFALVGVSVLLLAFTGSVSARATMKVPSGQAATAAFGRYLHHRYTPTRGYWTCPAARSQAYPATGFRTCLGEVQKGSRWHRIWAGAHFSGHRVTIQVDPHAVTTWVRHWWPYSRHFILVGPAPRAPGTISVNSDAFDWWLLAHCVDHLRAGHRRMCVDLDGNATGFFRLLLFKCIGHSAFVRCENSLGDVMRYQRRL